MEQKLLTRKEVAERLGVSPQRLSDKRYSGPKYMKLGHRTVRYRESDVTAFENQMLRQSA